jgi:transposase
VELAKLKSMGWSTADLATHFGRNHETIKWWFRAFRREKIKYRSVLKILGGNND